VLAQALLDADKPLTSKYGAIVGLQVRHAAIWDLRFRQPAVEAFSRGGAAGPVNISTFGCLPVPDVLAAAQCLLLLWEFGTFM
jgi:hypothetical protein